MKATATELQEKLDAAKADSKIISQQAVRISSTLFHYYAVRLLMVADEVIE